MKRFIVIAVLSAASVLFSNVSAQGPGSGCQGKGQHVKKEGTCEIPNLTEDQKTKIEALKIEHKKKMLDINNQIREKEAHLITVTTGEKINKDDAYKTIDEIAALKANREKLKLDHKLAVRALLSEEQKLWFDMHGMKGGHGQHHGQGQPQGQGCQSQSPGCGQNKGQGAGCGQGQAKGNAGGCQSH